MGFWQLGHITGLGVYANQAVVYFFGGLDLAHFHHLQNLYRRLHVGSRGGRLKCPLHCLSVHYFSLLDHIKKLVDDSLGILGPGGKRLEVAVECL